MDEKSPQFVQTELKMTASASLAAEIEKELETPDPTDEKAEAALKGEVDEGTEQ